MAASCGNATRREALLHAIVDQVARQVGKDRITAKASGLRVDRKLPTQYADVVRIVHEGADILAVFIVLATDKPILLERCFAVGLRLAFRQIDRRPDDRVRQLLDRDVSSPPAIRRFLRVQAGQQFFPIANLGLGLLQPLPQ